MNAVDMLAAALDLAGRGNPLFPVHTPTDTGCSCGRADCTQVGKHPRTRNGLKDATTDVDTITAWWTRWPDANIGLRTGVTFDVLDIDHEDVHEATEGWPTFDMPGGPVARTGRLGWHFYVQPTGNGNRAKIAGAPCDWRGSNGYVVAPPSLHESGRRYEWVTPSDLALHQAPAVLLELLDPPKVATPTLPYQAPAPYTGGGWSSAGIIGKMAIAGDKTRNNTLVWCANKLGLDLFHGKATREQIDRALADLERIALAAGLGEREVTATIRSGLTKGLAGRSNQSVAA